MAKATKKEIKAEEKKMSKINRAVLPDGREIVVDPYLAKKQLKLIPIYILLIIMVYLTCAPLLSTFGMSIKTKETLYTPGMFPKPENTTFQWYGDVLFGATKFYIYFKNSFIVGVVVMVLSTIVSVFAGYIISRYQRVFKKFVKGYVYALLILQMFPIVLMLIPLFVTFNKLGLNGTHTGLMISYLAFTLPLNIWMLQGFFDGIPIDMEESALIDGATKFQTLVKVVLPMSAPGVASVAIFAFNYCWNEYVLASIFLKKKELRTLPVGLQVFVQETTKEWNKLAAASVMCVIPILIFFVCAQKYVVAGLTAGAVKG